MAAPDEPLIADFDDGTRNASYGIGWQAAGDDMRGGNSTAIAAADRRRRRSSTGALEVSGDVGDGHPVSLRRHVFLPNGTEPIGKQAHGLLAQETLSFQARGDGQALHAS